SDQPLDAKHAATAVARQALHLCAVARGDLAHQGEAEADAALAFAGAAHAIEGFEDALALAFGDAWAAVGDFEHAAVRLAMQADLDGISAAVALRVLDQVAHQATQQARVALCADHAVAVEVDFGARALLGNE